MIEHLVGSISNSDSESALKLYNLFLSQLELVSV